MVYSVVDTLSQPGSLPDQLRKKVRVPHVVSAKGQRKLTALTCYDASFAKILENTSLDCVLVGDSLATVIQGRQLTLQVTIEDLCYHTRCVAAALKTPLLVADIPFGKAGFCEKTTFEAAQNLLRSGAEAVKIEGATPEILKSISVLVRHGIPVMGHIGLLPQAFHSVGGYKVQGKQDIARKKLLEEAKQLQDVGCFSLVLELVEAETAIQVTQSVAIPTIGIGAGQGCDGQILVLYDMLGMNPDFQPKFVKQYGNLYETVQDAVSKYIKEVNAGLFPKT